MTFPVIRPVLPQSPRPQPAQSSVLEVCRLTASYGETVRLRELSVAFPQRRITAILGPSGCGKSTLLRVLNRTLELVPGARVATGTVLLEGRDIYSPGTSPSWVRAHIGMLQQKPTPFPMSILDNVLFGARYHGLMDGAPINTARHYLEQVGLWEEVKDRLYSSALALSGGQQQRLCLARTLAVRPTILLMDEPCSALDPRATMVIEGLVRDLAEEYTIVIVTHNVAQARRIADHCIFIEEGRAIAAGTREDMLNKPKHRTVRDFVMGLVG